MMRTGEIKAGQTTAVVALDDGPFTITLKSADVTRKIELSTDGGVEFFEPYYDGQGVTANQIVLTITATASDVRFTGVPGDEWVILK